MKISVIVPVYNCESYLPACLDSILSQTFSDLEIIVVDDGSVDGSPAICDAYTKKDSRIRVIHQSNQGVSAARNVGLDVATGGWIGFVDADDTIAPDMYEVLQKLALEHDADIAHCGYKKVFLDGSVKEVLGTGMLLIQDSREASECLLTGKHFTGSPCTKLYKRTILQDINFNKNLKINEDVLLNAQIFQRADKLVFLDVTKYHYHERSDSATHITQKLKVKQDCVQVAEILLEMYQSTELESACADKLQYALLDLYRVYLFESFAGSKNEREQIHSKLQAVFKLCTKQSFRSVLNYEFMRRMPRLYVQVYRIYDRVRTPNIDL